MRKNILVFMLLLTSCVWLTCQAQESAPQLYTTGIFGEWNVRNVTSDSIKSITFYRDSDYKYGYTGSAYSNDGEYGELLYTLAGDRIYFKRSCALIPEEPDNCTFEFSTTFSIQDNVLTLDSFMYERGKTLRNVQLDRSFDQYAAAQVLLSGKWYIENGNDSIIYNFGPFHRRGGGIIWGVRGDEKLNGMPDYSIDLQEPWTLTIYNQSIYEQRNYEYHYIIDQLDMDAMDWRYEEEIEQGTVTIEQHLIHCPVYEKKSSEDTEKVGDDPGSSTVDPIDPNQVIITLENGQIIIQNGDERYTSNGTKIR